jgi:dihydrofolate synthase/folylpolyglutamate synthase
VSRETDPFQYLFSLEQFGIKFGLSNIQTLVASLGNPQHAFRSILIAGTNGKGSVTAMVDTALRHDGLRVGRYTSPHLIRLEERFAINGRPVETGALARVVSDVRTHIERLLATGGLEVSPTFFEATTAAAFELFRREGVEVGVLEVGLGGRLDATNIVDPVAVAITSIDFDHERYLGHTLGAIAAEKAGVIRPGIPVVVGPLAEEARAVVASICDRAGAEMIDAAAGAAIDTRHDAGATAMHLVTPHQDYGWVPLGLRGDHQARNALVAARLLEALQRTLPVTPAGIVAGLRDVRWPGRLQIIEVGGGRRVLLDAAHNPAGASALARYLTREIPEPMPLVFGAMRDKEVVPMLETLLPIVASTVMTQAATPRARDAAELAAIARRLSPRTRVFVEPHPAKALELAWSQSPLVIAAGSIFLIGDLIAALGSDADSPALP